MKIGLSTYSLSRAIQSGELTVPDAISWIAEHGGEHVEIVPIGFDLTKTPELIDVIRNKAEEVGLEISNYAISSNIPVDDTEAYEAEIKRIMGQVDIARQLGVKRMRHDPAFRTDTSVELFMKELPKLADACRRIADYAAGFGIVTSIENHGYYIQASDRVLALYHAVGHPNFKLTVDAGNFMCADEDSVSALKKTVKLASIVHLKDFYLRPAHQDPGEGWFKTTSGNYLRGAIFGQGDMDARQVLQVVKDSGYDGYLSLEFEGMEDCKLGAKIGLENVRRLWDEAGS